MTQTASMFFASALFFGEYDHSNVFKSTFMTVSYSTEKLKAGDDQRHGHLEWMSEFTSNLRLEHILEIFDSQKYFSGANTLVRSRGTFIHEQHHLYLYVDIY